MQRAFAPRRILSIVIVALAPGGCSHLAAKNAGIARLERAGGPAGAVAVGSKYAGWILGAPLAVVLAPVAALAWATPWVDLPLAVDIASAPAVGLGYTLQTIFGWPAYGALSWAGDELPEDAPADWVPPGFVVSHREATVPVRPAGVLAAEDVARYAPPAEVATALRRDVARAWDAHDGGGEPMVFPLLPQGPFDATLELYPASPRGEEARPLLLITPPTEAAFAARWLAARYARKGVHVAVVQPAGKFLDGALEPADVEAKLKGAVVTARTVLEALRALPEVDPARTCYLGVSAGAIFGAVLVAVEPAIARAALVFPGGDLPEIVRTSEEDQVAGWRQSWAERGLPPDALHAALAAVVVTDPLRLASAVDPSRVLLFLGDGDTKVPVAQGEQLRVALGEPETWRLAGNHDTAALCFGFVLREIDGFLFPE